MYQRELWMTANNHCKSLVKLGELDSYGMTNLLDSTMEMENENV